MKTTSFAVSLLAVGLFGACTDESGIGDPIADADEEVPGDEDPVPGCTAANDSIPLDELMPMLRSGDGVNDILRTPDGTVYFVSGRDPALKSGSIGRRVACGAIEQDWLSISAPIMDLEVSTDDKLYMSASHDGLGVPRARLYRLDLADATAFPERLLDGSGENVGAMHAGPDGRVYFLQGASTKKLRYVDGDVIRTTELALPFTPYFLAARGDGSLILAGAPSGQRLATVSIPASGAATFTLHTLSAVAGRLRADKNGGYYGDVVVGSSSGDTATLIHVPVLGGPAKVVYEGANHEGGFRPVYDLGASGEVLVLTPGMTDTVTSVALPVPLATM